MPRLLCSAACSASSSPFDGSAAAAPASTAQDNNRPTTLFLITPMLHLCSGCQAGDVAASAQQWQAQSRKRAGDIEADAEDTVRDQALDPCRRWMTSA